RRSSDLVPAPMSPTLAAARRAAHDPSARAAGTNMRKVVLFGLIGALGCLAGWAVGEGFLWATLPTDKEAGGSLASRPVLPPLPKQAAPAAPIAIPAAHLALSSMVTPLPAPPEVPAGTRPTAGA